MSKFALVFLSFASIHLVCTGELVLRRRDACVSLWGQCGGDGWSGSTCCTGFCTCTVMNPLFHRCDPPAGSTTCGVSPPTPVPAPSPWPVPVPLPSPDPVPSPLPSPEPAPSPPGSACTDGSSEDCSLNGVCVGGKCHCDAGWKGHKCTALDVLPVNPENMGYLNLSMPTWSGNVIEEGGKWHMFVGARAEQSTSAGADRPFPSSDSLGCNAHIARLEADHPEGPYHMAEVALPRMHFSPNVVRAPDGTVLLFSVADNDCPSVNHCCSNDNCYGCNFVQHMQLSLAWAPSVHGPWQETVGILPVGAENPSATVLSNGTVMLAYRVWIDSQEYVTTAIADSWRGPYIPRGTPLFGANSTLNAYQATEDPFIWHNDRGFHLLMHSMYSPEATNWYALLHAGAYGFSQDGVDWTFVGPTFIEEDWRELDGSLTPSEPWSGHVEFTNGSVTLMTVRQKPALIFNAAGEATHLINGVDFESPPLDTTGCYWRRAWTLVQPLRR